MLVPWFLQTTLRGAGEGACIRNIYGEHRTWRSGRQRSEVRKPKEIRISKSEYGSDEMAAATIARLGVRSSDFGFRISFGLRDSVFGLLSGTLLFTTAVLAGKIVLCSRML